MVNIRLLLPFRCDHHEIPADKIVGFDQEFAARLVRLGVAEYAGPQTAVVEPQETRVLPRGRKNIGRRYESDAPPHL